MPETTDYFAALANATYAQLTTFRRDGRAVPTTVHVVTAVDEAFFRTWDVAGKAKRLAHTPAVQIAPATFRGRPLMPPVWAEAHLLHDAAAEQAAAMIARRHPILHGWLIPWYHRRRGWTTQHYRVVPPTVSPAETGPSADRHRSSPAPALPRHQVP